MTSQAKIAELRQIIVSQLSKLIDRDYYLLEVPYYHNIGDMLIWQGELDLLATLPHKCLGMYALETFGYEEIEKGTLILFQGGGNFGDLWGKHHEFKMKVVERYPECRFVFLPQTVHFQQEANLKACAERLAKYPNVTICARDQQSYDTLKQHFRNTILLVPDLAFCIDMSRWTQSKSAKKNDLLLMRRDSERQDSAVLEELKRRESIVVSDWPQMEHRDLYTWLLVKLSPRVPRRLLDWYCRQVYRRHLVRSGVRFLSQHERIYSTRLHGAILALLLDKQVELIDNNYGKNSGFYDTWLADCENIKLHR